VSLNPIIALDHLIEEYRDHLQSEFRARDFQITAAPPGSGALFTQQPMAKSKRTRKERA